jgi:putative DNA primase/helicase
MSTILQAAPEVANVLTRLGSARRSGAGYIALCPAHDDGKASLSIRAAGDGGVLLHCFAGCTYSEIMAALEGRGGARPLSRWRRSKAIALAKPPLRITVAALADARKLPVSFLVALGVRNLPFRTGIEIPYRDERGDVLLFKRRLYLALTDAEERAGLVKFRWPFGAPLMAYGVWLLKVARRAKRLVLVEGESDCWTLWLHGIPALGLPGADSPRTTLHGNHLLGIGHLLIVQEDGVGGLRFKRNVAARLREIGFKGKASVFEVKRLSAKDASDLYLLQPKNFKGCFSTWMK